MRIALCYYGNVGWKLDSSGAKEILNVYECFKSIKEHIIDCNAGQTDIFVHTWDFELKDEIIKTLNPKLISVEKPKTFSCRKNWNNKISSFADLKGLFFRFLRSKIDLSFNVKLDSIIYRMYSRWYSTKKVIELKNNFEKSNGFEYDFVMLLRFDIEFYRNINFRVFKPNKFYSANPSCYFINRHNFFINNNYSDYERFNLGLINEPLLIRMKRLFKLKDSIFWCQSSVKSSLFCFFGIDRYSLSDTWFISDTHTMNNFGLLFDFIHNYPPCSHQSAYIHITKYLKSKDLEFPFSQLNDFEIRRYSKYFGAKIPDWNL